MVTKEERELVSSVVCGLLTGNYLLGRSRSDKQIEMHNEIVDILDQVDREESLSPRQKEIVHTMSDQFYGGLKDMSDQLQIDAIKLNSLLN